MLPLLLTLTIISPAALTDTSPELPPEEEVVEESADDCPEDKVCLDKDTYFEQVKPLLLKLKYIEENPPEVKVDGFTIVTDAEGRVFTDGTGDKPIKGTATWKDEETGTDYTVEFESQQDVTIHKKPPKPKPVWGFRLRVKAGLLLLTALPNWFEEPPTDIPSALNMGLDGFDLALIAEPLFLYDFNVQAYVGLRSIGAGLGWDITKNFGIMGGVSTLYVGLPLNPTISPFMGLYFSF